MFYCLQIINITQTIRLGCRIFYTLILFVLNSNAIDNNNLDKEILPSYEEAKKMIQIQNCLSELKNPPPDYKTVVGDNNYNESTSTVIEINPIEANNSLNNENNNSFYNNVLSFIKEHPHFCYQLFNISWSAVMMTTMGLLIIYKIPFMIIIVVMIVFIVIFYIASRIYKTNI